MPDWIIFVRLRKNERGYWMIRIKGAWKTPVQIEKMTGINRHTLYKRIYKLQYHADFSASITAERLINPKTLKMPPAIRKEEQAKPCMRVADHPFPMSIEKPTPHLQQLAGTSWYLLNMIAQIAYRF